MRVVVTGATGFVGVPLVRALLRKGHDVVVLSRSPERARAALPYPCEFRKWDVGREPPPFGADADVVLHLAGEPVAEGRWTAEKKRRIVDSRVLSTRALVEAIARAPSVRTFVCASAIGYYGDRGDELVDEGSKPGEGFLADVCQEWEAAARACAVRTAILRLGVVLGAGGGAFAALYPVFNAGVGGPVGHGRQWMSWIHVDDVVALFVHALEHEGVKGVQNAVAPEPATNAEFSRALGRALARPAVLSAPAFALRLALGEKASIVLDGQRVSAARAVATGFTFRFATLDEALREICEWKKSVKLYSEQWVPRSPGEVTSFFFDPRNLAVLTPSSVGFRYLGQSTPRLGEGTLIDYRIRVAGLPMRWQSRIESWVEGRSFVDVQTRGPYREWVHLHSFEPLKGGTLVIDRLRYALPLGVLGSFVAGWLVRRMVRGIFAFRRAALDRLWLRT